jgi:hypothetical protein
MSKRSSLSLTVLTVALLVWPGAFPAVRGAEQFEVARIFLELNHTDGDLGIHAMLDAGEPWTQLTIDGPGDSELLDVVTRGRLARQALTELSFESEEPELFEDLRPSDFFRRFPEGRYHLDARGQEGFRIQSSVVLSHVLAAPPGNVRLNNVPSSRSCDDPSPMVNPPVLIDWDPVTQSHPSLGKQGPVAVSLYQFVIEREGGVHFTVDLPPSVTQFEVPRGVTDLGKDFKYEIIARTATGNNTAVESCFLVP